MKRPQAELLKKSSIIALIIAVVVSLITLGLFNQLACEGQPVDTEIDPVQGQQIYGERIISQSFVAPRDGLYQIDLFLQTYQRQNTHEVTLRLLELPEDVGNPLQGLEVFRTTFNAANITDQAWHTFTFPPILDSVGKTYLITIESPESEDGDAITLGGIERDIYPPGTAYLGPTPTQADIAFRSCYQQDIIEKLQVLSVQITHQRPALWGSTLFYLVGVLLYGTLLIGFFWKLIKWAW